MGTASVQSELWGRQAETWAEGMEQKMKPLFTATVDALEPVAGLQLLDVGCGAGLALQIAASRGATVAGIDATPELLKIAAQRTPEADLRTADIEQLPYDNSTFDVVSAFNSIQYASDPSAAVSELARVCRPGGRVAIGIWGDPDSCETEALFARLRSLAPPPPGTPAPLACSALGVVEGLLANAGLTVTTVDDVACPFEFDDLDQAWTLHIASGPLQRVIDIAGADAVRATLNEVLETDRKSDGHLRQNNTFRFVIATKA